MANDTLLDRSWEVSAEEASDVVLIFVFARSGGLEQRTTLDTRRPCFGGITQWYVDLVDFGNG